MPSVFGGPIQGLSDRDVARLRRLAANQPLRRPVHHSHPAEAAERPWLRSPDCALAERLRGET